MNPFINNNKYFYCLECNLKLSDFGCFKRHLKAIHNKDIKFGGHKIFRCHILKCPYRSEYLPSIDSHMKTHMKPKTKCLYCDYATSSQFLYDLHIGSHRFCDKCNFHTRKKAVLKQHMLTHTENPNCPFCNYSTWITNDLNDHISEHLETILAERKYLNI